MNREKVAKNPKELGHPVRLRIYKRVTQVGLQGISVGDLQAALEIPSSTLSHHISALTSANLICQRREGRILCCVPECDTLDKVIAYLRSECCINER